MNDIIIWKDGQIHQGDVYRDIDYIEYADVIDGRVDISKIRYQYVVVFSQECDLTQDYNVRTNVGENNLTKNDKTLQNVIVAPMFNYEHFREGSHLSNLGFKMTTEYTNPKKTPARVLQQNNNPRYHYLEFDDSVPIVPSVIDFKHFFTLNINLLYEIKDTHYVCSLNSLFRERASQRFANYLSRIGLPE